MDYHATGDVHSRSSVCLIAICHLQSLKVPTNSRAVTDGFFRPGSTVFSDRFFANGAPTTPCLDTVVGENVEVRTHMQTQIM